VTREEWEDCDDAGALMRAIGDAHVRGTVTRRRLVQVMLRCLEPQAYLLPETALTALADLTAWANGADDVDLEDVRQQLFSVSVNIAQRDLGPAAYAVSTVYAAVTFFDGHAVDYARNAARNTGEAALCDVIRDEFSFDELEAA
jgi:hypothetical protein